MYLLMYIVNVIDFVQIFSNDLLGVIETVLQFIMVLSKCYI